MKLGMMVLVMSIMGLTQAVEAEVQHHWPEPNYDAASPAFVS